MLITNRPDGTIAATDYWQSGYNDRGLAYLSGHNNALRLLLPRASAAEWMAEIATSRQVRIEPPARPGYTDHIDIVFDDGSGNPFSLCLDRSRQLDRTLRSGRARLLIYPGSLSDLVETACIIDLPDAPPQVCLTHVTTNSNHKKRSYRADLDAGVLATVASWLPELLAGRRRAVYGDRYAVCCNWHNGKAAGFSVARLDGMMQATDIVRIAVCRHSKHAARAWAFAGGSGSPPPLPFLATGLLDAGIEDAAALPVIADFEQFLGWAWLDSRDTAKNNSQ